MAETHKTEKIAFERLKPFLEDSGRVVTESDKKQFDLKVDGRYCELKAKRYPFNEKFDFFYISENQKSGIDSGEMETLFLVCNTDDPSNIEIFEIPSRELREITPKEEKKYYYDKGMLSEKSSSWKKC